ncbi:hypothetical protein ACWD26_31425 [Streptomyces sp. NPDC002787]
MTTASLSGPTTALAPEVRGMVQGMCAGMLRRLQVWLKRAVLDVPELADVVPTLKQAVWLYQAGHYEECLAQATTVGRTLETFRADHPALPPL